MQNLMMLLSNSAVAAALAEGSHCKCYLISDETHNAELAFAALSFKEVTNL